MCYDPSEASSLIMFAVAFGPGEHCIGTIITLSAALCNLYVSPLLISKGPPMESHFGGPLCVLPELSIESLNTLKETWATERSGEYTLKSF